MRGRGQDERAGRRGAGGSAVGGVRGTELFRPRTRVPEPPVDTGKAGFVGTLVREINKQLRRRLLLSVP